jgi:type III secretion protein J
MRRLLLMIGLVLMTACESNKEIVSRLNEMEANDIVVFLAGRGIPSEKMAKAGTGGGGETVMEYTISVPDAHYVEAMALLSANGLPRSKTQSLLQIFPAGGMMQDPTERQIRYQAGLAETLAGMIRKFDGVLDAAVVLSIPPAETIPGTSPQRPSASVYVKHQGVLDDPNNQITSKIRRLLSGSVPGLAIDDVVVVSDRSRMAEISLSPSIQPFNAPEEWRSVFGVVVDKDSVGYLQTLLASLLALLVFSLAGMGWLFWKSSLVIQARGFKSLFALKPYEVPPGASEPIAAEGVPS